MAYIAKQDEHRDVYAFNNECEYTQTLENELIQEGTGLPANSTLIEVIPNKDGFARLFNEEDQKWEYVEDHSGEKFYSIDDGSEVEIKELGKLPTNVTAIPRPDQWHIYEGKARSWIMTEEQVQAKKEHEIKVRIEEINRELLELEQKILFANLMGDPYEHLVERVKELRAELLDIRSKKLPEGELEQGGLSG